MMRCLRDMNMSKFVAEDVPLFLSLIDDLFPSLKADRASFPDISGALEKVWNPANCVFDSTSRLGSAHSLVLWDAHKRICKVISQMQMRRHIISLVQILLHFLQ